MKGKLILSDGTVFEGEAFGALNSTSGEVVFNTGLIGYPESLTDPSYFGQILVLTYPLVGNYGVPDIKLLESQKIQIRGLIVQNYIDKYSHFEAVKGLSEWLKGEGVPALSAVDTRALTRKLRHHGVMLGEIKIKNPRPRSAKRGGQKSPASLREAGRAKIKNEIYDPNAENVLPCVSVDKPQTLGEGKKHIILIDCGAKENIVRSLTKRKVRVTRVPWDFDAIGAGLDFDAVMISNGPGDPQKATKTIETTKKLLKENIPTFGICLGSQLLGLAAGGATYKLKFGHRGQNQPVQDLITKRGLITSQNHGFAVDPKTLSSDWVEWFVNLNDGSNEGIRHKVKPFMSVQFHPEAAPGPTDADYLLDEFLDFI